MTFMRYTKWSPWIVGFIEFVVLAFFCWAMLQTLENGNFRKLAFLVLPMSGILIVLNTWISVRWLTGKDDVEVAESKVLAECFAALAICSAAILFYKYGADIDRSNTEARLEKLGKSRAAIVELLACNRRTRLQVCPQVIASLDNAQTSLIQQDEFRLKKEIRMVRDLLLPSSQHKGAPAAVVGLSDVVIEDSVTGFLAMILYAVLLAAAIITASRKIALALHDRSTKLKKPQTKIPLASPVPPAAAAVTSGPSPFGIAVIILFALATLIRPAAEKDTTAPK